MKRRHRMPFGAAVESDGTASFALWAPAARRVDLQLTARDGERTLAMARQDDGRFVLATDAARAGDRYRYVIDGERAVPDPASRYQPEDVHGPSQLVDPEAFDWSEGDWSDGDWRGRAWEDAVLYELHVGTFTPEGTFAAVAGKLDHLVRLGVTAIELMPLAEAPGARNWGYDGAYLFAPEARYGTPDDLKALIVAAHRRGLMVFLDVVYNHFGPEGNYLAASAPQFFTDRHHTPWGAAIDFDGAASRTVRAFFVHNALLWTEEFNFDGLRLDAVHAIKDSGPRHVLEDIALAVAQSAARPIHLVLENDDNAAWLLAREGKGGRGGGRPRCYTAQWNDDLHHALHVLLTGERHAYYADYADDPAAHVARALVEGFSYRGEASPHRDHRLRGDPSAHLPPTAFVNFLQNHDQVGNRPHGERIAALAPEAAARAATAIVLLAPSPPLLFMGEEWGSTQPFLFFGDYEPELAEAVRRGRRAELEHFTAALGENPGEPPPDPMGEAAFAASRLRWEDLAQPQHAAWLRFTSALLALRREHIVPRLAHAHGLERAVVGPRRRAIHARWRMGDGSVLDLEANLDAQRGPIARAPQGRLIFATAPPEGGASAADATPAELAPWFVAWRLIAA
jgi:malto-oligosyltrehalose trehalohydrolase